MKALSSASEDELGLHSKLASCTSFSPHPERTRVGGDHVCRVVEGPLTFVTRVSASNLIGGAF